MLQVPNAICRDTMCSSVYVTWSASLLTTRSPKCIVHATQMLAIELNVRHGVNAAEQQIHALLVQQRLLDMEFSLKLPC